METDPITVDPTRPHDLLAYLPYRLGYVPTQSLAVLSVLEPAPGCLALGLAARLDLADLTDPAVLAAAAAGISAQMRIDPTAWAVTVLYADAPMAQLRSGSAPESRVLSDWLARCDYADPGAVLLATPTRFRCLDCADAPCCPDAGHPTSLLKETAVAAQMVLAGRALVGSREELACPRTCEPDARAAAERAAAREWRAMRRRSRDQRRRWRVRVLDAFGAALAATEPGRGSRAAPELLGRLAAGFSEPSLRDAVVAWSISGDRHRPDSPGVLGVFDGMITGELRPPPTRHLRAAEALLVDVARHAPAGAGGYALAILGWLAWWQGEGARADVVVRQSLEEDPSCSLGQLLADVLCSGVRPGWARPGAYAIPDAR